MGLSFVFVFGSAGTVSANEPDVITDFPGFYSSIVESSNEFEIGEDLVGITPMSVVFTNPTLSRPVTGWVSRASNNQSGLNVRRDPTEASTTAPITRLAVGRQFRATGVSTTGREVYGSRRWYRIEFGNPLTTGWVHSAYVRSTPPSNAIVFPTRPAIGWVDRASNNQTGLNVRNTPTEASSTAPITRLAVGSEFRVIGVSTTGREVYGSRRWYQIEFGSTRGWVHSAYVRNSRW